LASIPGKGKVIWINLVELLAHSSPSFVAIGVGGDPRPSVSAHIVDVELGGPAEFLLGAGWDRDEFGDITWAAISHYFGDRDARSALKSCDELQD